MKKALPERIAARYAKKKISGRGCNVAKLLALRYDIEAAIHSGWPLSTIWNHLSMESKIDCSYETFRRLTRKHIRLPAKAAQDESGREERNQREAQQRSTSPSRPKMPGFEFRHMTEEELI